MIRFTDDGLLTEGGYLINILVVGAGAIGCLVGGQLAAAGYTVTLLGRAKLAEAIRAGGLQIYLPDGQVNTVYPVVVENIAELPDPVVFDLVLVTVKSFDTAAAVSKLAGKLAATARVLSLQNGVGNEETLTMLLGDQPIVAGSITLPVVVPQVGNVVVSKDKGGIGLSAVTAGTPVDDLAEMLRKAGFRVVLYRDYQSLKWSKLLMNSICNAIPAILGMTPAETLAYPAIFNVELAAMREILAVMRAKNIDLVNLPAYPLKMLAVALAVFPNWVLRLALRRVMVGGRGSKLPSLLLDMQSGRNQSEVNVLNKAAADAGETVGVAVPVNRQVSRILDGIVKGEIDWSDYKNNPNGLVEMMDTNLWRMGR